MRRRSFLGFAATVAAAAVPPGAAALARSEPAARERELEAWWTRQREKEAADRFWNGPRERRRNLTRDQIERWEYERQRRRFSPYQPPPAYHPHW
jgi:hypothetical protein